MSRSCGPCTACCTSLYVGDAELKKARFAPCPHLTATGCGVYDRRPKSCAYFACDWLRGTWGGEADRPDLSGVIVEDVASGTALSAAPGTTIEGAALRAAEAHFVALGRVVQAWDDRRLRITWPGGAVREFRLVASDVDGVALMPLPTDAGGGADMPRNIPNEAAP